jgi:alkylation response protein AidB-like acyl-CoA dehydrogenase
MTSVVDRKLLSFLLFDWLGVDRVLGRDAFGDHSPQDIEAMFDTADKLAASHFRPFYKSGDREEPYQTEDGARVAPQVRDAIKAFGEAGFIAASFPEALGGLGLPSVVNVAITAFFQGANGPFAAYSMLSVGNAGVIGQFGTQKQIETFMTPQLEGRWTGTMALSEPQAGSSLADIVTRATPDGEDELGPRYRLVGNKMWISGGEHDASDNIVHLLLAKIPGPDGKLIPGAKGISIFIVPKILPNGERNDIVLAGLNHKMGNRATTNCLLNLGEGTRYQPEGAPGAIGWRIGEVGQGLPIMFRMMNEARIGVGLAAAMSGYRGFQLALEYARVRPQGRPLGARDVTAPQSPIIQHADVKRMLLACKAYTEGALALILFCAKQVDDSHTAPTPRAREAAATLLGLLTPIAKTWPSEYALAANDIAIQVHGGYGYTRDFDVEQLYRDNRLNAIHEGTTGIQAIDLLGRKLLRDGGQAFKLFAERVDEAARAAPPRFAGQAKALHVAMSDLAACLAQLTAANDEVEALSNATNFLWAFGHTVVGFIWLELATVAAKAPDSSDADAGRMAACEFFFAFELPKVAAWLAPVASANRRVVTMQDAWF